MVCMSYYGTLKIIERLGEDHDVEVLFWRDELKSKLDELTVSSAIFLQYIMTIVLC